MSQKSIKVINIVLVILTILMSFPLLFNIYLQIWGKDKLPTAVTSTYVTTITDPHTKEELTSIEAKYFQNYNGKGKEVVELLFNCYSGVDKQAVYSRGFQLVINSDNSNELYYYDRYDDTTFKTGHEYAWGDPLIVDINGETYAVRMDGSFTKTTYSIDYAKIGRSIGFLGLNYIFEDTKLYKEETEVIKYTFEDLLLLIKDIIKSSSNGTGTSVIPLIDLGDFLHVYNLDEKGRVEDEPIDDKNFINSYFSMKTTYDKRGMVWAKQSMFKSVSYDSEYNVSGLIDNADYWQVFSKINLNESDFEFRESENGNYYYLSPDKLSELKSYSNLDIYIDFNLDKLNDSKVLGFDYFAFYGIKIKALNITSSKLWTIEFLENSLKNTNLNNFNYSSTIEIINSNSGVDL